MKINFANMTSILMIFFIYASDLSSKDNSLKMNDECLKANRDIEDVSIINLIATPEKYNGKCVRIRGMLATGHESNAIFLDEGSYKNFIYANSISLVLTSQQVEHFSGGNGAYALVEGMFEQEMQTDLSFQGRIKKISRIAFW